MDRSGAVVQDIVCVRDLSYTGLVWQLVGPFCFITRMTSGSEELAATMLGAEESLSLLGKLGR